MRLRQLSNEKPVAISLFSCDRFLVKREEKEYFYKEKANLGLAFSLLGDNRW